ncbi:MAG: BAX inhibitor (BI)-1/YccA family protein [Chloroflexi bacterium]|nr:MAG: BAX inhibitor (BI)-1/YccA family protein [Chloroflexota bacterium]
MQEIFTNIMTQVYLWMALGLVVTAVTAFITVSSPFLLGLIFSSRFVFWGLVIFELILVFSITKVATSVSSQAGLALFFLYAAVNGLTLSAIFLVYQMGTIVLAFGATAITFGIMSVIGYTTKQDLTRWGGILFASLIGLIIASVVNMFLASSALDWVIAYAGILIFMGLTVYDTKRIKGMAITLATQGDTNVIGRVAVMGALRLYLDFINLFLFILRLLGRRRR